MKNHKALAVCFIFSLSNFAMALDNDFLSEQKTGWFYYPAKEKKETKKPEEKHKPKIAPKQIEIKPKKETPTIIEPKQNKIDIQVPIKAGKALSKEEQQRLKDKVFIDNIINHPSDFQDYSSKQLEEDFQEAKRIALDHPTHKNVRAVQILNLAINKRSHQFADAWAYNITAHPELVAKSFKISGGMGKYKDEQAQIEFDKGISKLIADKFEMLYFYPKKDKYALASNFAAVRDNFDPNIPIHFLEVESNQKLIERYQITEFPSLWAHTKNSELKHLFSGVVFVDTAKEAIRHQFSSYFPNDPFKDLGDDDE